MKIQLHTWMVSIILTATCLSGTILTSEAQIILNQASYPTLALGLDSTRGITSFSAVPTNNGMWDLSTATYGSSFSTYTRTAVSGNATFPSATYSAPITYRFNSAMAIQATQMWGVISSGIVSFGNVIGRQAYGLVSYTGGMNDSLVVNQQSAVFTSPRKSLGFPATAGSTWSSNYSWDMAFGLTVAASSLSNAPGIKRSYFTILDSVKGWGKMRLKNYAGVATGWIDVLAFTFNTIQKDSFFLNGVPVAAPLLTALGLSQGQATNSYSLYYVRPGETQVLLSVGYTDASYTTPTTSAVHAARLVPTGVSIVSFNERVKLYPNPVTHGELQIQVGQASAKAYSYELTSAIGQTIGKGSLNLSNGYGTVRLQQQPGVYFLKILEDGQVLGVQKLAVK
jgi:hypothetical protein